MKIAPVSGDLLVKLALGAAVLGGLWWAARRASDAAGQLWPDVGNLLDRAGSALNTVNPASDQNLVNRGVNAAVTAATGRDENLGGWLYELTHPGTMAAVNQAIHGSPPPSHEDYWGAEPSPFTGAP